MFGSALTTQRPWAFAMSLTAMAASLVGGALIGISAWRSLAKPGISKGIEPLQPALPGRAGVKPQLALVEAERSADAPELAEEPIEV
jgi:hypothetical protein